MVFNQLPTALLPSWLDGIRPVANSSATILVGWYSTSCQQQQICYHLGWMVFYHLPTTAAALFSLLPSWLDGLLPVANSSRSATILVEWYSTICQRQQQLCYHLGWMVFYQLPTATAALLKYWLDGILPVVSSSATILVGWYSTSYEIRVKEKCWKWILIVSK